jgi:hypothetical protein
LIYIGYALSPFSARRPLRNRFDRDLSNPAPPAKAAWTQTGEGLDTVLRIRHQTSGIRHQTSEVRSFRQDLRILWIWNPFNLVDPIEQARTHLTNRERVRFFLLELALTNDRPHSPIAASAFEFLKKRINAFKSGEGPQSVPQWLGAWLR